MKKHTRIPEKEIKAQFKKLLSEQNLTITEAIPLLIKTMKPSGSDLDKLKNRPPYENKFFQRVRNIISHTDFKKEKQFEKVGKKGRAAIFGLTEFGKACLQEVENPIKLYEKPIESQSQPKKNIEEYTSTNVKIKSKIKREVKTRTFKARKNINYEKINKENRDLGDFGEEWTKSNEQKILITVGRKDLAEKVEIVAKTKGDGLGYDIDSYYENGNKKLIEVKTTSSGLNTDFFLTPNEIERSEVDADKFCLYRINVNEKSKEITYYVHYGALTNEVCHLKPASFSASFK